MDFKKSQLYPLIISLRPGQWIKNGLIFTAIIFNGQLTNSVLFSRCVWGFLAFCFLSSASYLINDLIDAPFDRQHPQKKHRPIASGTLSPNLALQAALILAFSALFISLFLDFIFFLFGLGFIVLHLLYSFKIKKIAVLDILTIASSFMIRTYAGEVLTGYHVPIWLVLTVVFISLLIASGKRRSELVLEGSTTRKALQDYQIQLLDFYNSTFANAALLSYALFTFFSQPPEFSEPLTRFLLINFPQALGRKWLMAATFPFVIVGIMRYAQLVYEENKGETPEKLLIGDLPLTLIVIGWGLVAILVIYVA